MNKCAAKIWKNMQHTNSICELWKQIYDWRRGSKGRFHFLLYLILYRFKFFKDYKFNNIWNKNLLLKLWSSLCFFKCIFITFIKLRWGQGRKIEEIYKVVGRKETLTGRKCFTIFFKFFLSSFFSFTWQNFWFRIIVWVHEVTFSPSWDSIKW